LKLGLVEEKGEDSKFSLISIPDHELPPEKLKYKKLQLYQKQALELRRQRQVEREQEEARMRELRENNPEVYLHQLKESYQGLSTRIKENERIRSELSNRKSKLKQRKMQAIARLAEQDLDSDAEQGEDDWLVYKDLD
jgi:actin-related protein 5